MMNEVELRDYLIREELQSSLIYAGFQGGRVLKRVKEQVDPANIMDPARIKLQIMQVDFETTSFSAMAYRPVRWLDEAVNDKIAPPDAADHYLKHKEGLALVRHKREHFNEYIPLSKKGKKMPLVERNNTISDPTGNIGDGTEYWLGNSIGVNQIIKAARETHAALAGAGVWPDWQLKPFNILDRLP